MSGFESQVEHHFRKIVMLLLNINVGYEDDYFKALWLVDSGILTAAQQVNIFNSEQCTRIEITGATQIPETNLYSSGNKEELEKAGIHLTLDDFIYDE